MRIGHGFDVHAFAKDRPLVLGGVTIPHDKGLAGHSDADVVIHAICDALLGAAGQGDIGQHFPDSSEEYKNIDSRLLLKQVAKLVQNQELQLANLDCTVIAQSPKLSPYIVQMQQNIAEDLRCSVEQVNIKATTTEKLGYTGREEGIAAHCVALLA